MEETITLYRPTGPKELALVRQSGNRRWPPRLPDQPIFYPVTNEAYAIQIARDWNTKNGETGYVTEFEVATNFVERYDEQTVGSRDLHVELWIPADDLDEFNDHIVGAIRVTHAFHGSPPREIEVDL